MAGGEIGEPAIGVQNVAKIQRVFGSPIPSNGRFHNPSPLPMLASSSGKHLEGQKLPTYMIEQSCLVFGLTERVELPQHQLPHPCDFRAKSRKEGILFWIFHWLCKIIYLHACMREWVGVNFLQSQWTLAPTGNGKELNIQAWKPSNKWKASFLSLQNCPPWHLSAARPTEA